MDINKLDPQRRELLEARFSKQYQPFENAPFNNGSSGSDSCEIAQVSAIFSTTKTSPSPPPLPPPLPPPVLMVEKAKTPPPTKGRKRKNVGNDTEAGKINRGSSVDSSNTGNIVGYFGKKIEMVSPQRSSQSPNRNMIKMIPIPPATSTINDIAVTSRGTQTDIASPEMDQLVESTASNTQNFPKTTEAATVELSREVSQLEQQLHAQLAADKKLKEKNARSVELLKEFLVIQATDHKKKTREETMRKRLRLGQFHTVRQGASFVEQWNDGYAFSDINKKLNSISQQKEELDKQRKYLSKRRPLSEKAAEKKEKKEKRLTDDGFARPNPVISLSSAEYHEQDEILRLRTNAIKKDEQELQAELEKLERERNIHIRELKRIHSEDQSRYNTNPILHDRYLLLELIGKGGFSEVFKGFDLKDLQYVACKVHQLNKDWKEDKKANYIKHAVREYTIHRSLDHPRIVQLHDVFEIDSNSFVTVLEYCDGNDLDFMLKQYKMIPEKETRAIMMQVVSALKYLNERKPPVIHYDLKPGNILLGSGMMSWEVKLTDFGLSKILPEDTDTDSMDLTSQGAGTYWYLPPECFVVGKQPPKISSKVDVWSVGIIFFQALYGRKPFGHNLSQASILEQNTILKATNIEFPIKPAVSLDAKNFIRKCLTYRKEERVDVFQLALDPYLKPKKEAKKMELQAAHYHGSSSTSTLSMRNNYSSGGDSTSN